MKWEGFHLAMLLTGSTLVSSACLSSGAVPEGSDVPSGAPMADILEFEQTASSVRIRVITTGCTRAEDFEPNVQRLDATRVQLTVLRIKPDDCRAMPASKIVEFSRESLKLDEERIILMNPLTELPGRG